MGTDVADQKNLLIFNLKTDADDDVLGFTTDWINALATYFRRVFVITMCAGRIDVAENVEVYSLGKEKGYSEPRRAIEFYRLMWRVLRTEKVDACFAHMMPLFAVMGWPLLRRKKIPILLWYGHKATPVVLRVAHRLVDRVVTSTPAGFRLKSEKVRVVGQGITEGRFPLREPSVRGKPFVMISVARLSPIKHIDIMIQAAAELARRHGKNSIQLVLLGDALLERDRQYKNELRGLVETYRLEECVPFVGSVPHREVPKWLRKADVSINLSPTGAVDKAALESLAMGIPVIVQNRSFIPLFEAAGVDVSLFFLSELEAKGLADKLERWMLSDPRESHAGLRKVSDKVLVDHGLLGLAEKIVSQIGELTS